MNKDSLRSKKWKEANPEKAKQHKINYIETHPKKYILQRAKARAKFKNLDFDLTEEDIFIPVLCPYLRIPLTNLNGKGFHDSNISLDRIDNSKGYIKGNVEVISVLANKMKSNASQEQLEIFATEVLRRAGKC